MQPVQLYFVIWIEAKVHFQRVWEEFASDVENKYFEKVNRDIVSQREQSRTRWKREGKRNAIHEDTGGKNRGPPAPIFEGDNDTNLRYTRIHYYILCTIEKHRTS